MGVPVALVPVALVVMTSALVESPALKPPLVAFQGASIVSPTLPLTLVGPQQLRPRVLLPTLDSLAPTLDFRPFPTFLALGRYPKRQWHHPRSPQSQQRHRRLCRQRK